MRTALNLLLLLIVALFQVGCQQPTGQASPQQEIAAPTIPPRTDRPVAYLDGLAVTQSQVYSQIAPIYGGEALTQILLDRAVKARLKQEGINLTEADLEAERERLLSSLATDVDQASRLLQAMRQERGLDQSRFENLLRRNAGLRRLIRDQIQVSDTAIAQTYRLRYGDRYQVRLITSDSLETLQRIRPQVFTGASFTDLAIRLSTDSSAQQGGLLSPISPADPTYPKAIRDALPHLKMDTPNSRLSPVIALDSGYAILWLEQVVTQPAAPTLDAVRSELADAVRIELEQTRMRQLARTFIEQADIVVLDPGLNRSWQQQQDIAE